MSYGSNLYGKDNPRSAIGNAAETQQIPGITYVSLTPSGRLATSASWARNACGNCVAWLIGLPRRAGTRMHARNDAEARWQHWQVSEYQGGLVRRYRDARFETLTGEELSAAPPDCSYPGGR